MLKNIFGQLSTLWRRVEHFATDDRIVVLISERPNLQLGMRILAIQQRWHLLFAHSLSAALEFRSFSDRPIVVVYDDLLESQWRNPLRSFLEFEVPVFFVLLCSEADSYLQRTVLEYGGFDAVESHDFKRLTAVVNGAFGLARSIETADAASMIRA